MLRMIHVKTAVLSEPKLEPTLGPYLLGQAQADATSYLIDVLGDQPKNPMVTYLLGRRLFLEGEYEQAIRVLERFTTLVSKPHDRTTTLLVREVWRLIAESAFQLRWLALAQRATQAVIARAPHESERGRARERLARIDWLKQAKKGVSGH